MFGKKIPLFKLFGFQLNIDYSWFFILALITWSLGAQLFPTTIEGLSNATYWTMGLAGALFLFASIVLHELAHSLVARHFGIEMKGITLFIFGGVAELSREPDSPKAEFLIAIAGPIMSALIAVASGLVFLSGAMLSWPAPVQGVAGYLGFVNIALVIFNMIPAFPLDGGRMLRAVLWHFKNDLKWATNITAAMGSGFGLALILLGFLRVLNGDIMGGIWSILIGTFLRGAAQSSKGMMARRVLEGEPIERFITRDPVTVGPELNLDAFVQDYLYTYHHKLYPVVEGERLIGCVTLDDIKNISRDRWSATVIRDVMGGCSESNTISADVDALEALTLMNRERRSRLIVTDGSRLVGVVTLKDLLDFLSMKMELEQA